MPYPNFHAFRLISPDRFEKDSFRNKEITDGIEIIVGKLPGKDTMTTQAYRFDKSKYSYDEAKKWLDSRKIKYILSEPAKQTTKESKIMDRNKRNGLAAQWIMKLIQEQDTSTASWASVNKSKLPKECFLWVEDPKNKSTWHLPYREGAGGIDPKTGMYKSAGPINLQALRAISAAVAGARTGEPMKIPSEIRGKIEKLLKDNNIGAENKKTNEYLMNGTPEEQNQNSMKHQMIDMMDAMEKMKDKMSDAMKTKYEQMKKMMGDMIKMMVSPTKESLIPVEESVHDGNITINESFVTEITEGMHDKENGIVKGISILRPTSKNCSYKGGVGREYSEQAMSDVAKMITGRKAYIDHQSKSEKQDNYGVRKLRDLIGVYENGRVEEKKVKADIKYLQTQPVKEFIEAIIKLGADGIGASIVGGGKSTFNTTSKMEIIESMISLESADWVSETGSTLSLFEAVQKPDVDNNGGDTEKKDEKNTEVNVKENNVMDYSQVTLTDLLNLRPDITEAIRESVDKQNEEDKKATAEANAVLEENKALKEENDKLKKENDEFKLKEAVQKKRLEIEKEISESKIPSQYVTEIFRESLMKEDSSDVRKKIIEDRKKIITTTDAKGVKGMGNTKEIEEGANTKKSNDEVYNEIAEIIGVEGK